VPTEVEPRRRRLEPDARREEIFSCAVTLFGTKPYAAVSTGDVADQAGVARGLVNHYFGTKRALYLEVVKRLVTLPPLPEIALPDAPVPERVHAGVDWFLTFIDEHRQPWVAAVGFGDTGMDEDLRQILADSDETCADRILEAVGLSERVPRGAELRATVRCYNGLVRAVAREWLVRESLDREQARLVLTRPLISLINEVFPAITAG
jgi:AcrR family transcriptional regulator